jgi:hypothetical protein
MFIILIFYYTLEVKKPFGEKELNFTSVVRSSSQGLAVLRVYVIDPEGKINHLKLINQPSLDQQALEDCGFWESRTPANTDV